MIQTQKVIKVGNSMAVTLDRDFTSEAEIKPGQIVTMMYDSKKMAFGGAKMISGVKTEEVEKITNKAVSQGKVNTELEQWTEKFIERNQVALKRLANL